MTVTSLNDVSENASLKKEAPNSKFLIRKPGFWKAKIAKRLEAKSQRGILKQSRKKVRF